MTKHLIDLDREQNPEFYRILDEHNSFMDNYNEINNKLYELEIPKLNLIRNKQKNNFIIDLNKTKKNIESLQKDYLDWKQKANAFYLNPKLILNSEKHGLLFLYYVGILKHMIQEMNYKMTILLHNYDSTRQSYENKYNFQVALLGLFFALIGLYLSLFF
ncbi:MAG: hypothetical protein ABIJ15_09435 [bacterium]